MVGKEQKYIGNTFVRRLGHTTNDYSSAGFYGQELPEKVFSCADLPQPGTWTSWVWKRHTV
jgi:hypothetical protein